MTNSMSNAPSVLAPIASSERIRAVDIARGLALLGILLVNARFFFGTLAVALYPEEIPVGLTPTYTDFAAWSFVEFFCTYKCMSLFSLLFGFGIAMQVDRLVRAGQSRWSFGARRLGVLFFIGVLHGTLIWYGDILTLYAILGVIVLAAATLSAKALLRAIAVIVGVLVFLTIAGSVLGYIGSTHPEWFELQPIGETSVDTAASMDLRTDLRTDLRGFAAMKEAGGDIRSPVWRAAETAAFRDGPYLDALLFRCASFAMAFTAGIFSYGWHALAMMLFGIWAFRTQLFLLDASSRRRRLARITFSAGFPLMALSIAPLWMLGLDDPTALALHTLCLELGGLLLPIGYAVSIVEWSPRWPRWLAIPLERAGRMALSVYLLESLVCVTLASWWGFAWFGSMMDSSMLVVALCVWVALVAFATLWLKHFSIGPMERLWRLASYGSTSR